MTMMMINTIRIITRTIVFSPQMKMFDIKNNQPEGNQWT